MNSDIFMWKPSDMPGILREVTKHALRIKLVSRPVQQRLRCFDKEKCRVIGGEVVKLLASRFIKCTIPSG
jgi:hypothetical protein